MNVHRYMTYTKEYDHEYLNSTHRVINRYEKIKYFKQIVGFMLFSCSFLLIVWLLSR